jgi:hypothetical protein
MRFGIGFLCVALLAGCAGPFQVRKTKWTVGEVKSWYADYSKNEPGGVRGIAYQGTDPKYHHFIARVLSVDNWAIIKVKKEELKVPEELPYSAASSAPFAHYYVDPARDFARIAPTR